MLVTVVILFLATELPQGLLSLCSGLVKDCFQSYYVPLGDTMDIVALVNNAVNFALYCTMSARFRQTFARLVLSHNYVGSRKKQVAALGATSDVTIPATSDRRFSNCRQSLTISDLTTVNISG